MTFSLFQRFRKLCLTTAVISSLMITAAHAQKKELYIYNWSDFIAEDTIANFEKRTGVEVIYDVFDSLETLEAKLLSGKTGYDLVFPTASNMARQIVAGAYQPLDRNKLSNWENLDRELMAKVEMFDPGNQYAVPYMWGTTGIGYNPDLVKKYLGTDAPTDSWDLVFNEENIKKLSRCGVAFLDAYDEVIPAALVHEGLDPNSRNRDDYKKAEQLLMKVRPYITYFHSSKFISDLANGDICVAVGWSGDIFQAADRAREAKNSIHIEYSIPKEGSGMYFDMVAMPRDAQNIGEAYQFLNYLLEPEVMANIQNYVSYASANKAAIPFLDDHIKNNPAIYPDLKTKKNLFTFDVFDIKDDKPRIRLFTKIKSGI
ncbi:extracellular solute-binding protein [Endozoicomonas sp. Mp262]|uniref:extracellular solute-binding protein n=1 Tax=Endozoicomonas sp. Mp262 TaxID=2919499 RepID=UPI0021E075CE